MLSYIFTRSRGGGALHLRFLHCEPLTHLGQTGLKAGTAGQGLRAHAATIGSPELVHVAHESEMIGDLIRNY